MQHISLLENFFVVGGGCNYGFGKFVITCVTGQLETFPSSPDRDFSFVTGQLESCICVKY